MFSEVVGLIEIDEMAPGIGWSSSGNDTVDGSRRWGMGALADRLGDDRDCVAPFNETDIVSVDLPQLAEELETEFRRLMARLPAR